MGTAAWTLLAIAVATMGRPAGAAPQFFGLGRAEPEVATTIVPAPEPARPPAPPAPPAVPAPPGGVNVSALPPFILGTCPPGGGRMLLSEAAVRSAVPYARVSSVLSYDGRGCAGQRDCRVDCVIVESIHNWRPADVTVSAGWLGSVAIQVTLLSEPFRGYSSRVTLYGTC